MGAAPRATGRTVTGWKVLATFVAVLVLSGCGGPSTQTLNDAVTATAALPGVAVELTGSTQVGAGTSGGTFQASGRADLAAGAHQLTVEVRPAGGEPTTTDVVVVEGRNHQLGLPGFPADQWVWVDGAPPAISADLPTFVDPLAVLNLLTSLTGDVTDLGTDTVEGAATQHLRVVLPPARMERSITTILEGLGEDVVAQLATVGEVRARALAEVWIDEEGWVRQLRLATTAGIGETQAIPGTGAIDNELLLTLTPLEAPPTIEAPAADDLARTTFADLFLP